MRLDNSQKLSHRYLYGPLTDQVLVDEVFSGTGASQDTLWFATDHQNSVRSVSDNAGYGRNHIEYDAFGNITSEGLNLPDGGGLYIDVADQLFHYAGQEWDADAKLQNNNARWYDPRLGRFLSADPSGLGGGDPNLYRYVGNSPLNATDPTGLYQAGNPVHSLFAGSSYNPYAQALAYSSTPLISSPPRSNFTSSAAQRDPILAAANAYFHQGELQASMRDPTYLTRHYGQPAPKQLAPISFNDVMKQSIESGAERRAVEEGNRQYALDAVKYGTPGQAFSAKFALGLNSAAESVHPMIGQLNAWGTVLDENASKSQKAVAVGFGLADTLLQVVGASAARTGVRTETNTAVRTTSRIQQELHEAIQVERSAQSKVQSYGEKVLQTQYAQGVVQRGLDFGSYAGSGASAKLFLNEVKNVAGKVAERSFTALGLGKSGISSFNKAIKATEATIKAAGLDSATTKALLDQLKPGGGAVIRLIGSQAKGTIFDPAVVDAIGRTTGFITGVGFHI